MGSSTAAAPVGRFLLYAATPAGDDARSAQPPPGLQDVEAALAALAQLPPPPPQQQLAAQPGPGSAGIANGGQANGVLERSGDGGGHPQAQLFASYVQSAVAVPEVRIRVLHSS